MNHKSPEENAPWAQLPLLEYFSHRSKMFMALLGLFLVVAISAADYLTGKAVDICIFYLVPIFMVTWFIGMAIGITTCVVCIALQFVTSAMLPNDPGITFTHVWNESIRLVFFIIFTVLLVIIQKRLETEKNMARSDFLTGAANSRNFYETSRRELDRSKRYREPLTLLYMDIDNFKDLNDRWGHSMGDRALRSIVNAIRENLRAVDVVARMGGDEFAILLPETDMTAAKTVYEKIHGVLDDLIRLNAWPITFSMGMITCTSPTCTIDELVHKADTLMYTAKESGKNQLKYASL